MKRYDVVTLILAAAWVAALFLGSAYHESRQPEREVLEEPTTMAAFNQAMCKHVVEGCKTALNNPPKDGNIVVAERFCYDMILDTCYGMRAVGYGDDS